MQRVQFAQQYNVLFVLCSGERVLCFHGPLLYEAKVGLLRPVLCFCFFLPLRVFKMKTFNTELCLFLQCVKINIKDKQIKYFIHYSGWNKKYVLLKTITFQIYHDEILTK